MFKAIFRAVVATAVAFTLLPCQQPRADVAAAVDSLVNQQVARDAFSGAVLIARNGSVVYQRAAGLADRANNRSVTLETQLQIASMSKLFTQIAIRQLEQAGKLSLSDTVGRFLPRYPNATVRRKVTVEQLIKHRSGVGSFWNDRYMAQRQNVRSVSDYVALFQGDSLLFAPGTDEAYSNGGYVLLGAIIEKVSGQSYHDYVRDHVFKPAGMSRSAPYDSRVRRENVAVGYTTQMMTGPVAGDQRLAGNGPRPGYENSSAVPSAPQRSADSAGSRGGMRLRVMGPDGRMLSQEEAIAARAARAASAGPRQPNTGSQAGVSSPAGNDYSTVGDFLKLANALLSNRLLDSARTRAVLGARYASRTDFRANGGGPGVNAEFSIFPSGDVLVVLSNLDPPAATTVAEFARGLLQAPVVNSQVQQGATDIRSTVQRVAGSVAQLAEQNYVFPDTGRMVAEHLRKRLEAGAYANVTELAQLSDRLTRDMQAVNGDRHLYVTYSGAKQAGLGATQGPRMVMRRPGDPVAPDVLAGARRSNYEIQSVQRLDGNVGYLSLSALRTQGSAEAFAVIDAAMAFLERTDAMIIDLRRTIGGEPRVADYMASYFFGPTPTPTLTFYNRGMDRTDERTTVPVKGALRPNVPLYLLVGPGTVSGTEDFAFIIKQTGRGTLVGSRTAGAGRLTRVYPVGDGFTASISGGRTFDPRTGREWERTGIMPDSIAAADDALTAAHAMALERLAAAATDDVAKQALAWTRTSVLARAKPASILAETLKSFAGEYESRVVTFEGGKLLYQLDSMRPHEELTPVADRTFALAEATRVEFVVKDRRVTGMTLVSPAGTTSTIPRTK